MLAFHKPTSTVMSCIVTLIGLFCAECWVEVSVLQEECHRLQTELSERKETVMALKCQLEGLRAQREVLEHEEHNTKRSIDTLMAVVRVFTDK